MICQEKFMDNEKQQIVRYWVICWKYSNVPSPAQVQETRLLTEHNSWYIVILNLYAKNRK